MYAVIVPGVNRIAYGCDKIYPTWYPHINVIETIPLCKHLELFMLSRP